MADADDVELYPHLKITAETFPRVLATRRVEDDGAEYFGAFLTKTAVRILIDFLNRIFRLRSCDIPIDGNFDVPCTQFYRKRCVAPCVASLCDRESYLRRVALVRLFLANRRDELRRELDKMIAAAAETLDFESAAEYRDMLAAVEDLWQKPRMNAWLDDDCVDTLASDATDDAVYVHLVTQRGRRTLGRKVFKFSPFVSAKEAIETILASFYRFHLPREIRLYDNIASRRLIAGELSERFGRQAKIVVVSRSNHRVSTANSLYESRDERELASVRPRPTPAETAGDLKLQFGLSKPPKRIEAFDVAHISATAFAAASSVWIAGHFVGGEYRFWISDESSELTAMRDAIIRRLSDRKRPRPDLILIDGGRSQLASALDAIAAVGSGVAAVSAVKPPKQHSGISHFLDKDGGRIAFDITSPAHRMLKLLRDDAHELANRVHRERRDMSHHYEIAALLPSVDEAERRRLLAAAGSVAGVARMSPPAIEKLIGVDRAGLAIDDLRARSDAREAAPLIVPIRFDAENGDADDLRPIVHS